MDYEIYVDQLYEYYFILEKKFYSGQIGHKQFLKLLDKLDQWEEQFVQVFEVEFEEDFE